LNPFLLHFSNSIICLCWIIYGSIYFCGLRENDRRIDFNSLFIWLLNTDVIVIKMILRRVLIDKLV